MGLKLLRSEGFLSVGTGITSALFHSGRKIFSERIEFMMLDMDSARISALCLASPPI